MLSYIYWNKVDYLLIKNVLNGDDSLNITIINDKRNEIACLEVLNKMFSKEKLNVTLIQIDRDDVSPCIGCFGCWIKTPGECVIKDNMIDINKKIISSDVVIFITPIIFGQYSCNIKNVVDRTLGKNLPFFKKFNGRTGHPARYEKYPVQYVIGCLDKDQEEDKKTFLNTHNKYRRDIKKVYISTNEEDMMSIAQDIIMEVRK